MFVSHQSGAVKSSRLCGEIARSLGGLSALGRRHVWVFGAIACELTSLEEK
jgi:hypothetical protein